MTDFKPYRKTMFSKEPEPSAKPEVVRKDWSLLNELPMASLLVARTGEVLFANQRALTMLSVDIEPLCDVDSLLYLVGEIGDGSVAAKLSRLLAGEELELIARSCADRRAMYSLSARRTNEDDVNVVMLRPHEEKPERVSELRAVLAAFKTLGTSLPNAGVLIYDEQFCFLLAEGEALEEAGYQPETLLGATLPEVVDARALTMLLPHYDRALQGFSSDLMHRSPRTQRDYHTQFLPIRSRDSTVIAGAVVTLDVTRYKKLELQYARQATQLALLNEDLEELAYISSHDLREPLRRLRQLVAWTREDLGDALEGDVERYTSLMAERLERLEDYHECLLHYVRSGRREQVVERVILSALIWQAWHILREPHGFELELIGCAGVNLLTCGELLRDIFVQLLANSVQHHDKKEGTIEVFYRRVESEHVFLVRDDGPGIPVEFHARVFQVAERFAIEEEGAHRGLGIGLALVKRLAGVQGGHARIISSPGQGRGLTVEVKIPIAIQDLVQQADRDDDT